jgi:hypothetical protein
VSQDTTPLMSPDQLRELFKTDQIVIGMRTENLEKPQRCICCGQEVSEYHDVAKLNDPTCLCTLCALEVTK